MLTLPYPAGRLGLGPYPALALYIYPNINPNNYQCLLFGQAVHAGTAARSAPLLLADFSYGSASALSQTPTTTPGPARPCMRAQYRAADGGAVDAAGAGQLGQ